MRITKLNRPITVYPLLDSGSDDDALERLAVEPFEYTEVDDSVFEQFAIESATEIADKLKTQGFTVAISTPDWVAGLWIDELLGIGFEPKQKPQARSLVLRLALKLGTLQVRVETKVYKWGTEGEENERIARIALSVHLPHQPILTGFLEIDCQEMTTLIVALKGARQSLVDEALSLLMTPEFGRITETLCPILAFTGRCHACDRPLEDDISRALQIGPACAKAWGIAHTKEMADKIRKARI